MIKNLVNNFGGQSIVGGINILKQNHKYIILNSKEENQDIINFIKFLEKQGLGEIKITFVDRELGISKMNYSIIIEAVKYLFKKNKKL